MPDRPISDVIASMRAADAAVDEAITLALRTAERNGRSRADFLQRCEQVWNDLFETEEAKAARHKAQIAAWEELCAKFRSAEYVADREAAEREAREREDAARAAIAYPVLYQARAIGKVVRVHADGAVELGRMVMCEAGETFVSLGGPDEARVVRLERTSDACPEQYDAFIGAQRMGYVRLRHGMMRVDYPECRGETVYTDIPRGDGMFEPDERPGYLDRARAALYEAWYAEWGRRSAEDIAAEVARQKAEEEAKRSG